MPDPQRPTPDSETRRLIGAKETVPISDVTALAGWEQATQATPGGTAAAPPDTTPGEPFGRYRLMEQLGHGGMGVVWKAWDTDLRRVVALKQILGGDAVRGQTIDRFLREARAAARLRHPNIVPVYDVGVIDGKHYLTADFVDGASLDKRMREELSVREAVALARAVAEALQYAHDQGVVHRDIKPGNILVDQKGVPHVADFGLAKDASPGSGPALTMSGDLLGTPSYMSPEQARGRPDEQGPASDQFSLGVMLYEMVTGRLPFGGTSLQDILNAITDSDPAPPTRYQKKLHADVETVILKTLEKDPARRYPSMRALAADLGRILDAEPIEARRPGFASRLARKAAKHRGVSAAALVVAVAGAALTWFAWRKHVEGMEDRIALRKTELVQSVLVRWGGVTEAVRELQENAWDDMLTPAQRRDRNRRAWEDVAQFMRETPADATSQATARALAGWARVLEGDHDEGMAWLSDSRRLDPDVPFGALLEGLLLLTEYCREAPVPRPRFSEALAEERPTESDLQRGRRVRIVALVKEAAGARVRAGELGAGLEAALRSIDDVCAGDFPRAERALATALGSGATQWCRIPLLLWRALIRRRLRVFDGAFEDLAQVERACPRWHGIPLFRGIVSLEEGLAAFDRGEDPGEPCRKAIDEFTAAAGAPTSREFALVARGAVQVLLAESNARRGVDPCPAYELALRDYAAAADLDPSRREYRHYLALVRIARGNWLGTHGCDPTADLEAGLSDLEVVLGKDPDNKDARWRRGATRSDLAYRRMRTGVDSRADHRLAIEDLQAALRLDPGSVRLEHDLGFAWLRLAEEEQLRGGDATAAARQALPHLDAVLAREAGDAGSLMVRGSAWLVIAQDEINRRQDSRASLDRATEDLRGHLKRTRPPAAEVQCRFALALFLRGLIEAEAGGDPRKAWESARAEATIAAALAPGDLRPLVILANLHWQAGALDAAVEACRKLAAASPGSQEAAGTLTHLVELLAQDRKEGLTGWRRLAWLAQDALSQGEFPRGRVFAEEAIASAPPAAELDAAGRETMGRLLFDLARVHARLSQAAGRRHAAPFDLGEEVCSGQRDESFSMLGRAIALGWNDALELAANADLEALRGDPRWQGLVDSLPRK